MLSSSGYWPGQNSPVIVNLPRVPAAAFEVFKNFYLGKHSGRVLTLQPSAGTADLNAIFYGPKQSDSSNGEASKSGGQKKHIICVNTYQMCLLLLFNMREKMTYEEIKDETSIPDRELTRALQPLSIGKASQRILIKEPKTKEIEPSHTFQVNDAFTSQLYRIKVQVNLNRKMLQL